MGNVTPYSSGGWEAGLTAMIMFLLNPFTYRGYFYDQESNIYYLQSRYYIPEWGRFLNADSTDVLQDAQGDAIRANLFAYCGNDPVDNVDPTGEWYTPYRITIFYGDNDDKHTFKKGAEYLRDDFNDIYGDCGTVELKYFYNGDFKSKWNALPNSDVVVLLCHGDPVSLSNGVPSHAMSTAFIRNLNPKKIKYLILLMCNAGHFSYIWENVAYEFSKKISGGVVAASDGRVVPSPRFHYFTSDMKYKQYKYTAWAWWRDYRGGQHMVKEKLWMGFL